MRLLGKLYVNGVSRLDWSIRDGDVQRSSIRRGTCRRDRWSGEPKGCHNCRQLLGGDRIRHPPARATTFVLDDHDASAGAQPAQQTREYDIGIRDEMQRVCKQHPAELPSANPWQLEIASEIAAHGNHRDAIRCQSFEQRDRRTIPVYRVDAAPAFEAPRERSRERTVAGSQIGPVACLPRDRVREQSFSVSDVQ